MGLDPENHTRRDEMSAKPSSLEALFAKADKVVAKPTAPKVPASDRPQLILPREVEKAFVDFISYDAVAKKIGTQTANQKELVEEGCFNAYTEYLWKHKATPAKNPKVEVKEKGKVLHSAIFQVQGRFRVNVDIGELPEGKSAQEVVIDAIREITDLSKEEVEALVNNELDFTPDRGIKNWSKIFLEGTDEERMSLHKLVAFIMSDGDDSGEVKVQALSPEDRANLMYSTARVTVSDPKKFLDRLPHYVHSLEQLRAVLSVIQPTHVYPSHMSYLKGASVTEQIAALKKVASKMLGLKDKSNS